MCKLAKYVRNCVVFWKNLHSRQKFYTTAGRDGRDKFQVCLLGFLTLHFSMLTLRDTITASSKDLECRERKRSWKHNGFDPLEQPLRLGSIGGQSCNSCKSWCGHLGKIHQPTNQPTRWAQPPVIWAEEEKYPSPVIELTRRKIAFL